MNGRALHPSSYDELLQLAKDCGRPVTKLLALAAANDPFRADHPTPRRQGEWFAAVWEETGSGPGTHLRRLHYRLISQAVPLTRLNGTPYENTEECWAELSQYSKAARYLGLVPIGHVVDRRNPPPTLFLEHGVEHDLHIVPAYLPPLSLYMTTPALRLNAPTIAQRFHLELWCEKSTIDDVLRSVGAAYGVNVVTAAGEISLTACNNLLTRARASDRPVRVLYISDFDPAGRSMPVAVARKLEYLLQGGPDPLDIALQPIALTHEQCLQFKLPRTPIKETERRAGAFEHRFGAGATELDALEALHPGRLRRIIVDEVKRFHDPTLKARVEQAALRQQLALNRLVGDVLARNPAAWDAIEAGWHAISAELEELQPQIEALRARLDEAGASAVAEIEQDLDEFGIEWPEPEEGDDYAPDEPLFSSRRDYLEQLAFYHAFQGKGPKPNGEDR